MKRLLTGAAALLASSAALCATMIPSSMINWVSVPTWPSVSAGLVFAGPTATTGAPTFRALVATDLPVVPVSKGGTNATAAGGAALDNITGFAATGFLTRTGAGTYAFQSLTNGITLGNLAQAAANTVLANATGSTANVAAFAMPSCSTSSSALTWTSGTGFTCNTAINASTLGGTAAASYALLASPTFTGTPAAPTATAGTNTTQIATTAYVQTALTGGGNTAKFTTLQATGAITPSSTAGIVGTTTNDSANAGSIGETLNNSATGVSLTSGSPTNVTSIPLTAGQWDVFGVMVIVPAGGTTVQVFSNSVSTVSGTFGSLGANTQYAGAAAAGQALTAPTAYVSVKLASSSTVYLVGNASFTGSTATANGYLTAIRRR